MKASSFTLTTRDGIELAVRRWEDEGAPHQWTFVVVHGHGEHAGRYQHFAEWFAPLGVTTYAMDQRGHGHSTGQRGHTPSLNATLDDIDAVIARAREERGGPLVLVGHSFGGFFAIAYTLDRPGRVDRAIFSAPALLLKVKVPAWKRAVAGILPRVAPRMSVGNEVNPDHLSHDPAVVAAYRNDPLVHNQITASMHAATLARGESLIQRAPELRTPFLLMHGRDDRIIDPVGSQRFFARTTAPGRAFCLYPGMFHEIFNEVGNDKVFADIESWLTERTDAHLTGWNPPP